mgnify:FL=1
MATLTSLMNTITGMTLVSDSFKDSGTTQVISSMYANIAYGRWSYRGNTYDDNISKVSVSYYGTVYFTLAHGSGKQTAFHIFDLKGTEKIYTQSGKLDTGETFNKIRVHGSTVNNFNFNAIYEMFFIKGGENDQIIINLIKVPENTIYRYESIFTYNSKNTIILPAKVNTPSKIYLTYAGAGNKWQITSDLFTPTIDNLLNTEYFTCGVYTNYLSGSNSSLLSFFKINNAAMTTFRFYGKGLATLQSSDNTLCLWGTDSTPYEQNVRCTRDDLIPMTLSDGSTFFKVRSTMKIKQSSTTTLTYEMYFLSGQKILIYIAEIPDDDTKANGNNYINLFGVNTPLEQVTAGEKIWLYLDDAGTSYAMKTGIDSEVSKIEILTLPTQNTFYLGSKLNLDGMTVRATFKDGTTFDILKLNDTDVSYADELGTQTATVTFRGATATFQTEGLEDKVASIDFTINKDHYMIGESLGYIQVTATRLSGKTETVNKNDCTISVDLNTQGTQTLAITYEEVTAEKQILVDSPDTASLAITQTSSYPFLIKSDSFETSGVTAVLTYSDGQTATVYSVSYSGYDNETAGEKQITASYYGLTATYTVEVVEEITRQVSNITMTLNGLTGKAIISGSGAMPTGSDIFSSLHETSGWGYGYKPVVKTAEIAEGITSAYGFKNCNNLVSVQLPDSLNKVEYDAFSGCTSLQEVTLSEDVTTINSSAFSSCTGMTLTIKSAECQIYDSSYTLEVAKIKGHLDSTAQSYAEKYNVEFESLETVTKIQITKKPEKTYHVGEVLSKEDFEVTATLDTGESRVIKSYEFEYDFSSAGEKTIKVTYGELSDSFTVNIIAYKFSELINTTAGMQVIRSTKNDDGTDTVDGVDWFKFNNVTANKLYISGNNWIGFGISTSQLKICNRDGATWNIYRQETTLDIRVKLLKIRAEGYTYYGGSGEHESQIKYELFLFDNGDMYLNVIKSPASTSSYAGTSSLLCNSETTNLSLNGATEESPIPVSFLHQDDSGLEWGITYKKYAFRTLTGIVATPPQKVRYKVKETFNLTGLIVRAEYDDGTSEELNDSDYTTTTPDMTTYGTKTVTITYLKQTTSFDILVIDVVGIEVTSLPDKTTYYEDDTFSSTGIEVSQVYNDGSKETVTDYSISEPGTLSSGDKNITVTYKAFSTEFTIHVIGISKIEVASMPKKTTYLLKQVLDTSGLVISVEYADGVKKDLTSGYSTSKLDSSEPGNKTITVTYRTHETTFVVHVYGTTKSIRISHYPAKIYYKSGEELDTTGLVVMIVDSQGEERETTEYSVSNLDTAVLGEQTITISYQELVDENVDRVWFDEFQVYVTKDATNPFMKDNAKINIIVHWPNGEFKDLKNKDIVKNSMKLKESICNERYFIWGGCISNSLTFQTGSEQFWDSGEKYVPHGDIELYIECEGTKVQLFSGTIDSGKRTKGLLVRTVIAYDHLYKYKNIDVSWWYKNQTTDKQAFLTQKHFRNLLFKYLGIEQEEVSLQYDDTYVPNTWTTGEMKVVDILQDLCLQNSVFGWMNRKGKFRYLEVKPNARVAGTSKDGVKTYEYYDSSVHYDIIADDNTEITEGRLWYPRGFIPDPYPGLFSPGDITAQEAYEENIYYIRDSFFVGNDDWIDYVFDADEYGVLTRVTPLMKICYGTPSQIDEQHLYIAQGYKVKVRGNPLTRIGSKIQIQLRKRTPALPEHPEGKYITWLINSYIMSRTMEITGKGIMETYSAENGPYNSNKSQLGKHTQTYKAETRKTRSRLATISYENFSDGSNTGTTKAYLKCVKGIDKDKFTAMSASERRNNTIYAVFKEE